VSSNLTASAIFDKKPLMSKGFFVA